MPLFDDILLTFSDHTSFNWMPLALIFEYYANSDCLHFGAEECPLSLIVYRPRTTAQRSRLCYPPLCFPFFYDEAAVLMMGVSRAPFVSVFFVWSENSDIVRSQHPLLIRSKNLLVVMS